MWGWVAVGGAAALLGLILCGWVGVQSFLKSAAFRQLAEREAGRALRVDGTFSPFQWGGDGVYSEGFVGTGSTSTLQSLSASQIRASLDYSALLDRTIRIPSLRILEGEIELGAGKAVGPAEGGGLSSEGSWWRPRKLALEEAVIDSAVVRWPGGSLDGSRLRAVPQAAGGWAFEASDGTLRLPRLPELDCTSMDARYQSGVLHLLGGDFGVGEAGQVAATGNLDFNPGGAVALQIEAKRVPLSPFLPSRWSAVAGGEIGGTMEFKRTKDSLHLEGDAILDGSTLKALPVLDRIAVFTSTDRFRSLAFQKVRAHYVFDGESLKITAVDAESQGLVKLEGGCVVRDEQIDGVFEVGVSPGTLRWLPGAQGRVFTRNSEGYLWTTVKISGPIDRPTEDLSARLIAAMPEAVLEGAVQGATEVEETLKQGAKGVLDLLLPTVP